MEFLTSCFVSPFNENKTLLCYETLLLL